MKDLNHDSRIKLSHIAIAVRSITESLKTWQGLLGLKLVKITEVTEQKVKVAMLEISEIHIELLELLSQDSPVGKFLEKKRRRSAPPCF